MPCRNFLDKTRGKDPYRREDRRLPNTIIRTSTERRNRKAVLERKGEVLPERLITAGINKGAAGFPGR